MFRHNKNSESALTEIPDHYYRAIGVFLAVFRQQLVCNQAWFAVNRQCFDKGVGNSFAGEDQEVAGLDVHAHFAQANLPCTDQTVKPIELV
jgi:hypothetical protein